MPLKKVNIEELKKLTGAAKLAMIEDYRDERENLFQEYLKLQDIIEAYNAKVQDIGCQIEQINMIFEELGIDLNP